MSQKDARHHAIDFDYKPQHWMEQAACVGHPLDWWFWDDSTPSDIKRTARAICESCPVRTRCAEYAFEVEGDLFHRSGVYGGLTPNQRREMRREAS